MNREYRELIFLNREKIVRKNFPICVRCRKPYIFLFAKALILLFLSEELKDVSRRRDFGMVAAIPNMNLKIHNEQRGSSNE